jgi:hypothetical protein
MRSATVAAGFPVLALAGRGAGDTPATPRGESVGGQDPVSIDQFVPLLEKS